MPSLLVSFLVFLLVLGVLLALWTFFERTGGTTWFVGAARLFIAIAMAAVAVFAAVAAFGVVDVGWHRPVIIEKH